MCQVRHQLVYESYRSRLLWPDGWWPQEGGASQGQRRGTGTGNPASSPEIKGALFSRHCPRQGIPFRVCLVLLSLPDLQLSSALSSQFPARYGGPSAVSLLPPEAGLPVAAAREALGRRSKKERPPGAPPALGPQTWYEERRHHLIQLPAGSPGVTDLTCLELSILGP